MPLQRIDEDSPLESYSTTRTLGYRAIHGAPTDDNLSVSGHSTNSTVSNLVGTGRVIGNVYNFAGKRLERRLGDVAHRAGFSPEAVYEKICSLYREDWKMDGKKGANSITK